MSGPAGASQPLFSAAETRCSVYTLTNKSPVPDFRIHEIVNQTVKHAPSAFNVQSARAVILLKAEHEKLWDIADSRLKEALPEAVYSSQAPKVQGFRGGYGTVLWFEDQVALDALAAKNPSLTDVIPDWSKHSTGMHQFIAWTALELEGFGANLQHYNFLPQFSHAVRRQWELPETWVLHAQLVFGEPADGLTRRKERTYLPLEDRVNLFS